MVNKKELGDYIAANHGLTKSVALEVVSDLFSCIAASLQGGGEVNIKGFGKFVTKNKAARTGRNPATGASVEIAAKVAVSFKPSAELKNELN